MAGRDENGFNPIGLKPTAVEDDAKKSKHSHLKSTVSSLPFRLSAPSSDPRLFCYLLTLSPRRWPMQRQVV